MCRKPDVDSHLVLCGPRMSHPTVLVVGPVSREGPGTLLLRCPVDSSLGGLLFATDTYSLVGDPERGGPKVPANETVDVSVGAKTKDV